MKYIFHLSLILLLFVKIAHSIEISDSTSSSTRYVYLIVPGQGDFGGTEHEGKLPQTIPEHYKEIIRLETPTGKTKNFFCNKDDFGQKNCQDLLQEKLDELFSQSNIKFMIHAYSQGTASILNYISNLELADQDLPYDQKRTSKIEALILESAMISGFSAMYHFTSNHFRFGPIPAGKICSWMPYSDRWVPLLAKLTTFPDFDINGMQTVEILENIPKTFPIIILHSTPDYILPFDGAVAMYQKLRKPKNNNVYLIPINRMLHIDMTSLHIQHKEKVGDFVILQNKGNEALSSGIKILKSHNVFNVEKKEKKKNKNKEKFQPNFDKRYDEKYLANVKNVRSLYNTLVSVTGTVQKFTPLMAFLAISYAHYKVRRA